MSSRVTRSQQKSLKSQHPASEKKQTASIEKKATSKRVKTNVKQSNSSIILTSSPILSPLKFSAKDFVGENKKSIKSCYKFIEPPLGSGNFGKVYEAIHIATNQKRAIKIIEKKNTSPAELKSLIKETEVLRSLDHPNILKIHEYFQTKKQFYVVTELCTGGDLFDKISELECFTENQAAQIMQPVLSAIAYCHKSNLVHRDLKPENVLYDTKEKNSNLKVIDFGTAKYFNENTAMSKLYGSMYYIAPEVIKRKYTEKCDVWSLGVMLYMLLSGSPPFNSDSSDNEQNEIMELILKGKYSFNDKIWKDISSEAKDLIKKMLEYDPQSRISVLEALDHPWFKISGGIKHKISNEALLNLKSFASSNKLQETIWNYIVDQLSTKDEKNKLLSTFKALDVNGDGKLSKEELIQGYLKLHEEEEAIAEVERILKSADTDGSGSIDYSEFVAATIDRNSLLNNKNLKQAFQLFDKDGDGSITTKELYEFFNRGTFKSVSVEEWKNLVQEVDSNGDGVIDFKEFTQMMMKLSESA